jgi:CP family cyanate transporter-like MFS transporter
LVAAPLLLIAVNLRPAVAGVGPVLPEMASDLLLSPVHLAVLAAGPVFAFGLFAPVAVRLRHRFGLRPSIVLALLCLLLGLLVRLAPGVVPLFGGTLMAAVGIAGANVLALALIKEEHAGRVGLYTGLYTVGLSCSAMVAAGVSAPLQQVLPGGWRASLGIWALPVLVAVVVWLPRARKSRRSPAAPGAATRAVSERRGGLARDPLSWLIALFFGLQSLAFYGLLTWLPPLLRAGGESATAAGLLLSLGMLVQLPVSLLVPMLATRTASQAWLVLVQFGFTAAALGGMLMAPGWGTPLWMVLLGVGQGGAFALSLILVVLRTRDANDAAALSGITQTVGYLLAGLGPLLLGVLHEASGSWSLPLAVLLVAAGCQVLIGLGAARPRVVGRRAPAECPPGGGAVGRFRRPSRPRR